MLLANGQTIDIADVAVGDLVFAHDPETGLSGARAVTATWPHTDTLIEFEVGDGTVTTTEDHEFWNVTDQAWQETQHIDEGDYLLTADGETVVAGNLLWDTTHHAPAYDLTVDGIHTYHVTAGDETVLVHNQNQTCNVDDDGNVRLIRDDGTEVIYRVDGTADFVDADGIEYRDIRTDVEGNPTFQGGVPIFDFPSDLGVAVGGRSNRSARLTRQSDGTFVSDGGLTYGPDLVFGDRVDHVLQHSRDKPGRTGEHGVFVDDPFEVIDQAWAKKLRDNIQPDVDDPFRFDIELDDAGLIGGAAGNAELATHVRIIVNTAADGTRNVISAFPVRIP